MNKHSAVALGLEVQPVYVDELDGRLEVRKELGFLGIWHVDHESVVQFDVSAWRSRAKAQDGADSTFLGPRASCCIVVDMPP